MPIQPSNRQRARHVLLHLMLCAVPLATLSSCAAILTRPPVYALHIPDRPVFFLGTRLNWHAMNDEIHNLHESIQPDAGHVPYGLQIVASIDLIPSFVLDLILAPMDGIVYLVQGATVEKVEHEVEQTTK